MGTFPKITKEMEKEQETRIRLDDNGMEIISKMSENNPGAAIALMALITCNDIVDPISAFGKLSAIFSLDSFNIYGSMIHVLFKDVCQGNPARLITLMRAAQLGFVDRETLHKLSNRRDVVEVSLKVLYAKVVETLDNEFDPQRMADL